MKQIVFCVVGLMWFLCQLVGWHVLCSLAGDDAHPGTVALPFATISKGASVLTPGDKLQLMEGVYAQNLVYKTPSGTSWEMPVIVGAYPGHRARSSHSAGSTSPPSGGRLAVYRPARCEFGWQVYTNDVVNIGYISRQPNSTAHHIRLERVEVLNAKSQGILTTAQSHHCEFLEVHVHHNGRDDKDHGLYLQGFNHVVRGGNYHHNKSYGIHAYGAGADNVVRGATIHHNRVGVMNTQPRNLWVNNVVHDNTQDGIRINNGDDSQFVHNTIVSNGHYGINVNQAFAERVKLINNIVWANRWKIRDAGTGTIKLNNLTENPLFVDEANLDYRLLAGSPAIDRALDLGWMEVDFAGKPRPVGKARDLGAFEFGELDVLAPGMPVSVGAVSPCAGTMELSSVAPEVNADGSMLLDLAGYHLVFRRMGTAAWSAPVALGLVNTYTLTRLTSGQRYMFGLSAVDASGHEGAMRVVSDRLVKTIPCP